MPIIDPNSLKETKVPVDKTKTIINKRYEKSTSTKKRYRLLRFYYVY